MNNLGLSVCMSKSQYTVNICINGIHLFRIDWSFQNYDNKEGYLLPAL